LSAATSPSSAAPSFVLMISVDMVLEWRRRPRLRLAERCAARLNLCAARDKRCGVLPRVRSRAFGEQLERSSGVRRASRWLILCCKTKRRRFATLSQPLLSMAAATGCGRRATTGGSSRNRSMKIPQESHLGVFSGVAKSEGQSPRYPDDMAHSGRRGRASSTETRVELECSSRLDARRGRGGVLASTRVEGSAYPRGYARRVTVPPGHSPSA